MESSFGTTVWDSHGLDKEQRGNFKYGLAINLNSLNFFRLTHSLSVGAEQSDKSDSGDRPCFGIGLEVTPRQWRLSIQKAPLTAKISEAVTTE